MAHFKAKQVDYIRNAVAAGREAVRESERYDAADFAFAFIAAGGVQIPGAPNAEDRRREVADALMHAVRAGHREHADPDVQRELDRAYNEVRWVKAQADDKVVGFFPQFPEHAHDDPEVEALAHASHGFGPGVVRKSDILVLQPACDGTRFVPVLEDEIEC